MVKFLISTISICRVSFLSYLEFGKSLRVFATSLAKWKMQRIPVHASLRSRALVCARVCGRVRRNALSLTDGSLNFDRLGGTLRALREREVGDPMIIVNYYYYYYEAWNPYRTRTKIARYFTDGSLRFFFPLPTTRTLSRVLRYVSSSYRFAPWLILFVSPASRRTIIIFYCQLYALSDARYA